MRNEKEIRQLMQTGMEVEATRTRALRAVSLARRQVGQRDTMGFALFRIWAVLARLLAPLFAFFGERQAQTIYRHQSSRPVSPGSGTDSEGEKQ